MKIVRHIDQLALKNRYLNIYHTYNSNSYYQDNSKLFSELIILIEDYPKNYIEKLDKDYEFYLLKQWITGLFIIEKPTAIDLSLENKVQFILNDITNLPFCKCKVKLRVLNQRPSIVN